MLDSIRVAFNALNRHKLRSALTMLGVTIGVTAVIVLTSLGQAVDRFIRDQFMSIGTNLVFVFGEVDSFEHFTYLTEADVEALSDVYNVPDAIYIMPALEIDPPYGSQIIYEGQETTANVMGVTVDFPTMFNRSVVYGRYFTEAEQVSGARVAVIGQSVAEDLFGNGDPLGREIRARGVRLRVIGVLDRSDMASFGPGTDQNMIIVIPLKTAQERMSGDITTSGERIVNSITLQASSESTIDNVVQQVRLTLRERHNLYFSEDDDFSVATQEEMLESMGAITGLLTIFLGVVAGISLLVGGIGIMNIMLVTVTERTHEIGIRKAVGAQRSDILIQFLTESVVLSLFGGTMGVVFAWLATLVTSNFIPTLTVVVQLSSVTFAAMISVLIGVFFGVYPANRASQLNPIDALRYE